MENISEATISVTTLPKTFPIPFQKLEINKKDPKKMKKTGFAARLEAMQKQQEQMMKERQNKK